MKNTAQTNVENLIESFLQIEEKCRKTGMNPVMDDRKVYAIKEHEGLIYVSDGKRWAERVCLVRNIDVYSDELVSIYYYLRNLPVFPQKMVYDAGMRGIAGPELLDYFEVGETVVFDHRVKDKLGRSARTVFRG